MSTRRAPIPRSVQAQVLETYGGHCWLKFPGCLGKADTLDHLKPYSKGGTDSVKNLRPACRHCNSLRADRLVQGRGIEVHVFLQAPRVTPRGVPDDALRLDFDAMLGMLAVGRGVDDDVWRIGEAMWKGAAAKALRIPSAIPVALIPPVTIAADQWREWLRLGYVMHVDSCHPSKDVRCDTELRAHIKWMRSNVNDRNVAAAVAARDDDWRRMGLVF